MPTDKPDNLTPLEGESTENITSNSIVLQVEVGFSSQIV
jgi:hypothetical protein